VQMSENLYRLFVCADKREHACPGVSASAKVCVCGFLGFCMRLCVKSAFLMCAPSTRDLLVSSAARMIIKSFIIVFSLSWPVKSLGATVSQRGSGVYKAEN